MKYFLLAIIVTNSIVVYGQKKILESCEFSVSNTFLDRKIWLKKGKITIVKILRSPGFERWSFVRAIAEPRARDQNSSFEIFLWW